MVELDWKVVSTLVAVSVTAWSMVVFWAVKWLLDRHTRHVDYRFEALDRAAQEESKEWQRLEKDFLRMQADLPNHYVRREDYIRFVSVVDAKMDAQAARMGSVEGGIQQLLERTRIKSEGSR